MNVPFLRPCGCPIGVDPAAWRRALEQRIDQHAAVLSSLIDAPDTMDGDADFEPTGDEMDISMPEGCRSLDTSLPDDSEESDEPEVDDPAEPMLGAPEQDLQRGFADQTWWIEGSNSYRLDDAEEENEHGSDILDVPHCWDRA
jgi:hypothetical protein